VAVLHAASVDRAGGVELPGAPGQGPQKELEISQHSKNANPTAMKARLRPAVSLALAAAVFLTGCTAGDTPKPGAKITDEKVAKIVKERTTVQELTELFGEPVSCQTTNTGLKYLRFSSGSTKPGSGDKTLTVIVNDGVVTDYAY
jgi:hypothetical protein